MKLSAKIGFENNGAHFLINDEKVAPFIYALSDIPASRSYTEQATHNIGNFGKAGVNIVQVDSCIYYGWEKDKPFNFDEIERELMGAVKANPNAAVIMRLHINPPVWWLRENMEEAVGYAEKEPLDTGVQERLITNDEKAVLRVSLASEKWMKEAGEYVAQLCKHLSNSEAGDRLIGIMPACGVYGEWHQWGLFEDESDYGISMQKRFRRYVKEIYGTEEALSKAWGTEIKSFDKIMPPTVFEKNDISNGIYRDLIEDAKVIDYVKCIQLVVIEAIMHFCKIVKESFDKNIVTGAFYGYHFDMFADLASFAGHLEPHKLMECPYIDYIAAPLPYMNNRHTDGYLMSRSLVESVGLNKKLWLDEMDQRPVGISLDMPKGDPEKLDDTITLLKRDIIGVLMRGAGAWYFDHRIVPGGDLYKKEGWWDYPKSMEAITKIQKFISERMEVSTPKVNDVAVVFDTDTYYYMRKIPLGEFKTEEALLKAIGRSGAGCDYIHINDLPKTDIERYKCVIFISAVKINSELRDFINNKMKKDGRHIIWCYNTGYYNDDSMKLENITELTEIDAVIDNGNSDYKINIDGIESINNIEFSQKQRVRPDGGEVIAHFVDDGKPAVAYSEKGEYTSWHISVPVNNPSVMRGILKKTGAHIYCDKDASVCAGRGLVLICANEPGEYKVTLKCGKEINFNISKAETFVFDWETGEKLI